MNLQLDYSDFKRIVIEAVIIVCFSMAIGLTFNYQMIMNAFEGKIVSVSVSTVTEPIDQLPAPVSLIDVQDKMQNSILVDARIVELYAESHLPGAISLPLDESEARLTDFKKRFPPERSMIIYCSGYGCSDSFDLGVILIRNGYNDVMIYEGGFPEWRDAGLPMEEGMP